MNKIINVLWIIVHLYIIIYMSITIYEYFRDGYTFLAIFRLLVLIGYMIITFLVIRRDYFKKSVKEPKD